MVYQCYPIVFDYCLNVCRSYATSLLVRQAECNDPDIPRYNEQVAVTIDFYAAGYIQISSYQPCLVTIRCRGCRVARGECSRA